MKRKMSHDIVYEPLPTEDHANTDHLLEGTKKKKKGLLCASSRKRMYVLMILSGLALLWVFFYYKLLNHRFELPEPFEELRKMFGDGEVKKRRGRWDETENVNPSSNEQNEAVCLKQFTKERSLDVIHISLVACGNRVEEALTNMKSVLLVTNHHIHFHIFTDEKNYNKYSTFDEEFNEWPAFSSERWMMFTIHRVHYPIAKKDESEEWSRLFKPCASQRLFLASILVNLDAVLYVDTDILFLQPPEDLWKKFEHFSETQLAGMANECESKELCWYSKDRVSHPFVEPYGVNSGVMLMNLTRMRERNWEKELIKIYSDHKEDHILSFGDQDILNIYFNFHPELLYSIPCVWNYRPDHCLRQQCSAAKHNGISILHGNREVFRKRKLQPEFYIFHELYEKFDFSKHDFQNDIVNATIDELSSKKYSNSKCGGRIKNAILKHIRCNL